MPLALKIVLTALIALVGAIWLPMAFILGLQPLRSLLWDLSYAIPGYLIGPMLIVGGLIGLVIALGIPAALLWLIWRRKA